MGIALRNRNHKKSKEMKKDNLKEKNWLDIIFSISALFVLVAFYWLLGMIFNVIMDVSGDASFSMFAIVLICTLIPCLFVNILIQIILNAISVKNKIKSYLFFVALNIDMFFLGFIFFANKVFSREILILLYFLLSFIIPIVIKSIISIYYYKKLQKITLNEKN
jgi:uncharacterized membrane protein